MWNGDVLQIKAFFKGMTADGSNAFWNGDGANFAIKFVQIAGKWLAGK
ncbi:hypothetical protein [Faecalibacterium duncaniae]|nr:hypothetical protein [Faecalibacterium duncaniae]UTB40168.1 hypothetical protein NKF69_13000 [Faecalibacterium duncaniae]